MRYRILLSIVAICGAVCLLAGVAAADYYVGLTHGTNKVRPEFAIPTDNTFHLFAARNEWEPFQVLVMDDNGLTNVDVDITPFTGPGDPITDVEPYRVAYVPVTADTISHKPPNLNNVGDWPDGLIPFVDHFVGETRAGAPFDVAAGRNQAVFVDVYAPEDQTPGDYTATVTVTADGHAAWTGTVTLTVWNFTLPNSLPIASQYGFNQSEACAWHAAHGGTSSCSDLIDRYLLEFARHRMSTYGFARSGPSYTWNDANQDFDWDWTDYDAINAPYFDGTFYRPGYKFSATLLPGVPGGKPGNVSEDVWEQAFWGGWAAHFREKGWLDQLFYYLPDEPTPDQYPAVKDLAQRIHNADPDLQTQVTEQFEDALAGPIDIWDPDEPWFSDSMPWAPYPEAYDARRALGEKTWWYNCVSANFGFDWANHMIDYPSSQMRIWLWLTRRYHFEGILFWETVFQYNYTDPWESMYIGMWWVQGDGTLFYPGTPDHIGGATDIPIASLRMKYLREAMEDYEYFHLLDDAGYSDWVDDLTRTVAPKSYIWEHDWQKLLDARERAAKKLLGTLDEIPPAPPTNLHATAGDYSITLSWTPPGDADLAGFDIWYGAYEGDRYFAGSVGKDVTTFQINDLEAHRPYTVWMNSFDDAGNRSADSASVSATPTAPADDDAGDDDATGDLGVADDDGSPSARANADEHHISTGCGGGR